MRGLGRAVRLVQISVGNGGPEPHLRIVPFPLAAEGGPALRPVLVDVVHPQAGPELHPRLMAAAAPDLQGIPGRFQQGVDVPGPTSNSGILFEVPLLVLAAGFGIDLGDLCGVEHLLVAPLDALDEDIHLGSFDLVHRPAELPRRDGGSKAIRAASAPVAVQKQPRLVLPLSLGPVLGRGWLLDTATRRHENHEKARQ